MEDLQRLIWQRAELVQASGLQLTAEQIKQLREEAKRKFFEERAERKQQLAEIRRNLRRILQEKQKATQA